MIKVVVMLIAGSLTAAVGARAEAAPPPTTWPSEDVIRMISVDCIDVPREGAGVVVGVIDAH